MAVLPTVTAEVAWFTDPLSSSPTWTDVSAYLRRARTHRGRSHELARMQAGTAELLFKNDDDRFNPWNTASPYYGNLLTENQSYPAATTGWTNQANAVLGVSTLGGFNVLTMTSGGAGDMTAAADTPTVPVIPGRQYTAMASVRAGAATNRLFRVDIQWYSSAPSLISTSSSTTDTSLNGSFTGKTVTATAPANAATAVVAVVILGASGAGEVQNVTHIGLNGGSTTTWTLGGQGGLIQPRRAIRITATYNAVTYNLFRGFIESIEPQWPIPRYADVRITAVDGFSIIARALQAKTYYFDEVMADTPAGYWRLNETGLSTVVDGIITAEDNSGNNRDGTYQGSPANFEAVGSFPAEAGTAVQLARGASDNPSSGGWIETPSTACPSGTGDWTIEAWVTPRSINQPSFSSTNPADRIWYTAATSASLAILEDGTVNFAALAGGNGGNLPSTAALTLNRRNHVVCVKSGTTGTANWKVYINGSDVSDYVNDVTNGTGDVSMTADTMLWGGFEAAGLRRGAFDGVIDEVAVYHAALSSTRVLAHFNAARGLTIPQLGGTRIGGLLDLIGWPAGDRAGDAGQFYMAPISGKLYDQSILPYILDVVDSEGYPAAFFMSGDGKATFHDRAHSTPSSSGTFGDTAGTELNPRSGSGGSPPVRDDTDVYTTVVVEAEGLAAQHATDSTAVTRYGPGTLSLTNLKNDSAADLSTLAAAYLARYKTPVDRVSSITLRPAGDPANLWPKALGLEINDRILYKRHTLPGAGKDLSLDLRIEGITQDLGPQHWETIWATVPT